LRIWSLHPKYLDARGLVALWREGLLAQAVLMWRTRGYRHHPQLARFHAQPYPVGLIAEYLRVVCQEAATRGYRFDVRRIGRSRASDRIGVTRGQLEHEWNHLLRKLRVRDPRWRHQWADIDLPQPHPLFRVRPGGVADWEKAR
jgi:pyrimidine dimer DNA glycosylase